MTILSTVADPIAAAGGGLPYFCDRHFSTATAATVNVVSAGAMGQYPNRRTSPTLPSTSSIRPPVRRLRRLGRSAWIGSASARSPSRCSNRCAGRARRRAEPVGAERRPRTARAGDRGPRFHRAHDGHVFMDSTCLTQHSVAIAGGSSKARPRAGARAHLGIARPLLSGIRPVGERSRTRGRPTQFYCGTGHPTTCARISTSTRTPTDPLASAGMIAPVGGALAAASAVDWSISISRARACAPCDDHLTGASGELLQIALRPLYFSMVGLGYNHPVGPRDARRRRRGPRRVVRPRRRRSGRPLNPYIQAAGGHPRFKATASASSSSSSSARTTSRASPSCSTWRSRRALARPLRDRVSWRPKPPLRRRVAYQQAAQMRPRGGAPFGRVQLSTCGAAGQRRAQLAAAYRRALTSSDGSRVAGRGEPQACRRESPTAAFSTSRQPRARTPARSSSSARRRVGPSARRRRPSPAAPDPSAACGRGR